MGSPSSSKDFTVTIIGGRIGGLTLAAGLLRRNVPIRIFEAAPAFTEIRLSLSIGPAAHRAMPLIDPQIRKIYDSLVTTHADSPGYESFAQTWFEIVWASGVHENELLMNLKALPSGQTTLRRANFLEALVDLIPPEIVHLGKRLAKLEETADGVSLQFDDGFTALADVVVGCDGIKSKVKESMLPEESKNKQPQYNGMYGYRAVLDMVEMVKAVGGQRARVSTMYIGDGAYGISYLIMRAQKVNVGLYILCDKWNCDTWVRLATKEDMQRDASNMGRYWKSLVEVCHQFPCSIQVQPTKFCCLSTCLIHPSGLFLSTLPSQHIHGLGWPSSGTPHTPRHHTKALELDRQLKMHMCLQSFSVIQELARSVMLRRHSKHTTKSGDLEVRG